MLGCGALAVDMELTLFFTLSGLNIIRKEGAEKIELPGAPNTLPGFSRSPRNMVLGCSLARRAFPIVQRH